MSSLYQPFKHFITYDKFCSTKVSANPIDTAYTLNGIIYNGIPDVSWSDTCFIHDVAEIWNRGRFYSSQKYLTKLAAIAKNTFRYDPDKCVITVVEKSPEYLSLTPYEKYPGILPSIVVCPETIDSDPDNFNRLCELLNAGCDILSTSYDGTTQYSSTATDVVNYETIQNDMVQVLQWMTQRGIFTRCHKFPEQEAVSPGLFVPYARYMQQYEEYGLFESAATGINTLHTDNMMLTGYTVSTVADAVSYLTNNTAPARWIILIVDTTTLSGDVSLLTAKINDLLAAGTAIYLQMNEALKMFGSEFNINYGGIMPFRVYKDGVVDATLSEYSQNNINFSYTDTSNFRKPMMEYIFNNTSYNSFGSKFLEEMASYMYNRLAKDFMAYNATYLHSYMAENMGTYFLQADKPATQET